MLVFVDESGDPGFKIAKGSSKIFVTAMIIFEGPAQAIAAQDTIRRIMKSTGVKPEFKFNKCSDIIKDASFEGISEIQFASRLVVVAKNLIYSESLRNVKESFYKFFIRQMIEKDGGVLKNAKLVIDGSGDRTFKKEFRSYLTRRLNRGSVSKISLRDSKDDLLLQLADMVAGAVARSYRVDRPNPSRWRDMLKRNGQLQNVWEFK